MIFITLENKDKLSNSTCYTDIAIKIAKFLT